MKNLTREWVKYAEDDYEVIEQLFIRGKNPPLGAVCFHCQQCIEKYIKAFLVEQEIDFPKTHWLTFLLDLAIEKRPEWDLHRNPLTRLSNFATETRYPGEEYVNKEIARDAVDIAIEMREVIRTELNIV